MPKPITTIINFVFAHIEGAPLATRIEIYESLAAVANSKAEAAIYLQLAADLRSIETRHSQLVLDFQRRDVR